MHWDTTVPTEELSTPLNTEHTARTIKGERGDKHGGTSWADRGPLSFCVFTLERDVFSAKADRWTEKKGRKKKDVHSQGWTEIVPARSAPALPTKLLGCSYLSDKWPKKEGVNEALSQSLLSLLPPFCHSLFASTVSRYPSLSLRPPQSGRQNQPWISEEDKKRPFEEGKVGAAHNFHSPCRLWQKQHESTQLGQFKKLKVEEGNEIRSGKERTRHKTMESAKGRRHTDIIWAWTSFTSLAHCDFDGPRSRRWWMSVWGRCTEQSARSRVWPRVRKPS